MRPSIILLFITSLLSFRSVAQGWIAEVRLFMNHNLYMMESIQRATVTYSGHSVTDTGSPGVRELTLTIQGTGPITGDLSVSAVGYAYGPGGEGRRGAYLNTHWSQLCTQGYFEQVGTDPDRTLYVWITVSPRLIITNASADCDQITLTTPTCGGRYTWEASKSLSGPFYTIKTTFTVGSTLVVTPEELKQAGLSDPYGRTYFRVTGKPGTTSETHVLDIYYPGPEAEFSVAAPQCPGGRDGSIRVDIHSSFPFIKDFVVTLFADPNGHHVVDQKYVNNGTSVTFSGLAAGSYWTMVQNNTSIAQYGSCWLHVQTPPVVDPPPVKITSWEVSDYNGFVVSCFGASDGAVRPMVTGGTGVYPEYQWNHTTVNVDKLSGLKAGDYTVRVKDSNGCWSEKSTRSVTAPSALKANAVATTNYNGFAVSCHDKSDGGARVEIDGGVGPYRINWSTGSSAVSLSGLKTGNYSVEVLDVNGCRASSSTMLPAPSPITFSIHELTPIRCAGDESGVLEIRNIVNTVGVVSIQWSTGELSPTIVGKPAGHYVATVSDAQGCKATRGHTLTDPPAYSLTIHSLNDFSGWAVSCDGASDGGLVAVLNDQEGAPHSANIYTWTLDDHLVGAGAHLDTLRGLSPGVYRVQADYNIGCTVSGIYVLDAPPPIDVEINVVSDYNGVPISCAGAQDARLQAKAKGGTGDYSFLWSGGRVGPDLHDVGKGVYQVMVSDNNGCTALAEKEVEAPDTLKAMILIRSDYNGWPLSCAQSTDAWITADVSGGVPEYQFLWNTGESSANLIDVPAGAYTVEVTDKNGCEVQVGTTVVAPPLLDAVIADVSDYDGYGVSCPASKDGFLVADAIGGVAPYRFEWTGEHSTSRTLQGIGAGAYSVSIVDGNGCTAQTAVSIREPAPLEIRFDNLEHALCGEARGSVSSIVTGGRAPYRYSWLDADGAEVSNYSYANALTAGVYKLTVSDTFQCTSSAFIGLTATDGPEPRVTEIISTACFESSDGQATVTISGGREPYALLWQDGQQTATATSLSSGEHFVQVTDADGCVAVAAVEIPAPEPLEVILEEIEMPRCTDGCDGLLKVNGKGGNGQYVFMWEEKSGPVLDGLCAGNYTVNLVDARGCTTEATYKVIAPPPLKVEAQLHHPRCFDSCDGEIFITAPDAYRYRWSSGADGATLGNLCAGTHTVVVTDYQGCEVKESFVLENPAPTTLSLGPPVTLCQGQTHIIDAGQGWKTCLWQGPNDFFSTSRQVELSLPGIYRLHVVDAQGCEATDTFEIVTTNDLLKANFLVASEAWKGDSVVMIDISWPIPEEVYWEIPSEMAILENKGDLVVGRFEKPGDYAVVLSAHLGKCHDTMTKWISVLDSSHIPHQGRQGHAVTVVDFSLYPNPNRGEFQVYLELSEPGPVHLAVWSMLPFQQLAEARDYGKKSYVFPFKLQSPGRGAYTLFLDYGSGQRSIRFIVR